MGQQIVLMGVKFGVELTLLLQGQGVIQNLGIQTPCRDIFFPWFLQNFPGLLPIPFIRFGAIHSMCSKLWKFDFPRCITPIYSSL